MIRGVMKKIFIFTLISFFASFGALTANEKTGSQHEYGFSILGSYEYEETQLMHLRGGSQAESNKFENLGFIYTYKNSFFTHGVMISSTRPYFKHVVASHQISLLRISLIFDFGILVCSS